ncbi:LAMI_0H01904g1_1 [Lachancea mirantina]|uniref:LAMI_0H01904g1_1 n=1 Tax=Lachancea mirantina TaxID=1230905 RepID=A0A1G4KDV0_9SACH|nr:LAMI_0H01904g1_1 [Lachancea mirantina]
MAATATLVGALACQRNSFLAEGFETTVLKCEKTKEDKIFEVQLQDTILFPEGGGQPSDLGELVVDSNDRKVSVFGVERRGLQAIHRVNEFVEPGTSVKVTVDWQRRFDFMQQHTGQHLVSAILDQWELPTLSWCMGGVPTYKNPTPGPTELFNYIEIGRKLTADEISKLSHICHEHITVNPQKVTVVENQKDDEACENDQADINMSKIPDDYDVAKGVVRTIHIGDMDANPCCGTHLTSTAQIGSIFISPNQGAVRGTNSRIYFMCGYRVLKYTTFANALLGQMKSLLSCSEPTIVEKVSYQLESAQKTTKREQYWKKKIATVDASTAFNALKEHGKCYYSQDEFGSLDYLTLVHKEIESKITHSKLRDYVAVISGREKATNSGALIVVSDSADKIASVTSKLQEICPTLKGGGGKKGGKWQGKVVSFKGQIWENLNDYLSENFKKVA